MLVRGLIFLVLLYVGASLAAGGYGRLASARHVRFRAADATAPPAAGDTVDVTGTVETVADETVPSPLTGEDAVVAHWWIDEFKRRLLTPTRGYWTSISRGYRSVPFDVVSDDTRLRVDLAEEVAEADGDGDVEGGTVGDVCVEGVDVELDAHLTDIQGTDDYKEEWLKSFETISADVPLQPNSGGLFKDFGKRQYFEGYLEPGDTVSVLGEVAAESVDETPSEGDGDATGVAAADVDGAVRPASPDDPPVVVLEGTKTQLLRRGSMGVIRLLIGLFVLAVALSVLFGYIEWIVTILDALFVN